ncbi:DUF2062 domain-containing protein [Zoogloea sp.]|uniref:DUF2062 domain-containing protein n=1 Tax=Zoogloea sp. TaxID=49181 RepID=UPI0026166359|nr:DUF2062 domain-containing protein [Zoogloea sp.]MDD3355216.1 DUF2062 domain-containing protein [Zoogloea sp.]
MNLIDTIGRFIPSRESLLSSRWLGWLSPWLGHPKLWRWSRKGVALGVALGVFFGLLIPLAQIPVTAAAAIVLRANLPVAAASTLVTNPITFGPVYYAAYRLGGWITGASPQTLDAQDQETPPSGTSGLWERIRSLGKPLLVGLAVMASLGGLLTYLSTDLLWRWRTRSRWKARQQRKRPG